MNKYEGLFIFNTAGKEEGIKEMIDKVSAEIATAGGKVDTVQKMEKRSFSRIADKRHTSGFYANIVFEANGAILDVLRIRMGLNPDVFRVMFTVAAAPKPVAV